MKKVGLDKKGQASAELLFISLIVLVVIAGMLSLVGGELNQIQTGDMGKARALGEKIAGAVNAVYVGGNGYRANVTIPGGITNPMTNITISNSTDSVEVRYMGNLVRIKVIPTSVGSFTINSSTTTDKIITIRNQNGNIYFS